MAEVDLGADLNRRFEYAKAYYKKSLTCSDEDDIKTYVEISFALGFSFLEGTLSYIFDHFSNSKGFDIFERSVMMEQDIRFIRGEPSITSQKFRSIDERLQFLFWRFSHQQFDTNQAWWSSLSHAIGQRNDLMHPKKGASLTSKDAERCLTAIIQATDALFKVVFNKGWPKAKKGLSTSIEA